MWKAYFLAKCFPKQEQIWAKPSTVDGESSCIHQVLICWSKPKAPRIKVNMYGTCKETTNSASATCVIRDDIGRCRTGAARNLGQCSSLQVELWAALMGLDLAWTKGYRKIIIKTDSKLVEALLKNNRPSPNSHNIIARKCLELCQETGKLLRLISIEKQIFLQTELLNGLYIGRSDIIY